ncbi:MAG: hypothetical protein QG587_564, partial [Chloroflexota bacterium]|nr:hypothetical protein [Chloroflexota bacterium]
AVAQVAAHLERTKPLPQIELVPA